MHIGIRKVILTFFLLLGFSSGNTQTHHVYSYLAEHNDSMIVRNRGVFEPGIPPEIRSEAVLVNYKGSYYYFLIHRTSEHSLVSLFGTPYQIILKQYEASYVMYIMPLKFHSKHDVAGLRVFVYTNDKKIIENINLK